MPIFEYICTPCGNRFEKLHKSDTAEEISCPACGSAEVKKEFSAFSAATSPAACFSGG
jgi:putative FmdB family regulatory protein